MKVATGFVVCFALATAVHAGEQHSTIREATGLRTVLGQAGPSCTGGVAIDDGTFENGYRTPFAVDARFVQRITPPFFPALLTKVCVSWSNIDPATMSFNALVYGDNGVGGKPGTLLGAVPSGVSAPSSFQDTFVGTDCTSANVVISSGNVFVGAGWNAAANTDFFVSGDESLSTPLRVMFSTSNGGATWDSVGVFDFEDARALGVRAEFSPVNANICIPDLDTLCVSDEPGDNRFKVEIQYSTTQAGGKSGSGQAISLADKGIARGGLFWFFSADNPELLIKVLNGCGLGGHYWVFYSAGTNVGLTLTVTDTVTGHTFERTNPDLHAVDTVQATTALPCT